MRQRNPYLRGYRSTGAFTRVRGRHGRKHRLQLETPPWLHRDRISDAIADARGYRLTGCVDKPNSANVLQAASPPGNVLQRQDVPRSSCRSRIGPRKRQPHAGCRTRALGLTRGGRWISRGTRCRRRRPQQQKENQSPETPSHHPTDNSSASPFRGTVRALSSGWASAVSHDDTGPYTWFAGDQSIPSPLGLLASS